MKPPEVSIVIGAYNCGNFIQETIKSVTDQTFKDWELIIVDDCSTDDTYERIKDIHDERIKVIRRDKNSGLPAVARNEGIKAAKGEFIAFLDHDDIWFPKKLSLQVEYLKRSPDVGLVSCSFRTESPDKRYDNRITAPSAKIYLDCTYKKLLSSNFIACSSAIVKANLLDDTGYFDENPKLVAAEDWDLWLRIARNKKVAFIPETLGLYRLHSINLSASDKRLQRTLEVIDKHLKKGWITHREADEARSSFYFHEGWLYVDQDSKISRSLFYKALRTGRSDFKTCCMNFLGIILSGFPFLCRFIKKYLLDRKIKYRFTNNKRR